MKVSDRQSLFDIAVQECGSVESIFGLCLQNNLSVTDDLLPGQELVIPGMYDGDIAGYFKNRNIRPATSINEDQASETIAQEGIEHWAIEVDFIVS